jgi:AbiU2
MKLRTGANRTRASVELRVSTVKDTVLLIRRTRKTERLFETCVLRIARLTDPPKSVDKSNLTIQTLPDRVTDGTLIARLNVLIQDAKTAAAFCRDSRNRQLAHKDLDLALGCCREADRGSDDQEDEKSYYNFGKRAERDKSTLHERDNAVRL